MRFPELWPCLNSIPSITFSDFVDCSGLQRQPVCIHPGIHTHTHARAVGPIGSGSWATPALSPALSQQTLPFSARGVLPTHTLQCPLRCGLSPPPPTALFSSRLFFIFRIQIACHLPGTHLTLVQGPPNCLSDMEPSRCRK